MNGTSPCDPEAIFELADGSLEPGREPEVRAHLRRCSGCRTLFGRELRLNASLGSLAFEQPGSVCQHVAMALPTRSVRARLLWAGLAAMLLLIASATLMLRGTNLAVVGIEVMTVFWEFVAGFADIVRVAFAAIGPALLVALAAGALVDLVVVAVYLSVSRRRAREV